MRITAKGEYATKTVLYLTFKYPQIVPTQEIAKQHSIPAKYLEHILLTLKKAGLLYSRRGVRGGYQLSRPPEQVSVGDVLAIVDGEFARAGCAQDPVTTEYACPELAACGLKAVWKEVREAVEQILYRTTFDDLKKRTLAGLARRNEFMMYEV